MVNRLATALDIPFRQHNALLIAAGFAPQWPQRDLAAPDLVEVTSALDYMLGQQEAYPAVVVDRHWNLLKSNTGAVRLMEFLMEFLVGPLTPGTPINVADALVAHASLFDELDRRRTPFHPSYRDGPGGGWSAFREG